MQQLATLSKAELKAMWNRALQENAQKELPLQMWALEPLRGVRRLTAESQSDIRKVIGASC